MGTAFGLGGLVDRPVQRGVVNLDGLVRSGADVDLGEPGRVNAHAIRGQDAGFDPVVQADIELHDGVARVDPLQSAVTADPRRALPGRRRRRGIRRGAARAGWAAGRARRPGRKGAGTGRRRC